MTAHARKQLRDAAALALTGLATTGGNVFSGRKLTLRDGDLPGLVLTTPAEESEPMQMGNVQRRTLLLQVRGVVKTSDDVETQLDQIAAEVEAVLGDNTLGDLCKTTELSSTQLEPDDPLDQSTGAVTLSYRLVYLTSTNDPTIFL